jgi:hypothetical protein
MYKLLFITLFSISLYANENELLEKEDLFKYSSLHINDTVSFYAAQLHMDSIEDENAYSIGLLLKPEIKSDTEFGVGYIKTTDETNLLTTNPRTLNQEDDEGVLFFMNYKF